MKIYGEQNVSEF